METVVISVGLLFLIPLFYLVFLAIASLVPDSHIKGALPKKSFCIIIPAHNEEKTLPETIAAARNVDYPKELYEIVVIADNCTDQTAGMAQQSGAKVMERREKGPPGKGFVLEWAFSRLVKTSRHDAFIVIDADTWMARDFLSVMNDCLCSGEQAIQAYSQVRHPERSIFESLSFLGFALNRNLRYRGRSRLGWSANLMGTGMCFSKELLKNLGWHTTTLVEDVEYTMFLRVNGIRVCFADRARISVELHSDANGTERQRLRWDMGKIEVRNRYLPRLLECAIKKGDIACLDSAMELILPPFPIFFLATIGASALFLPVSYIYLHSYPASFIWSMNATGLLLYTIAGIISARAAPEVYRALLYAPFVILWRVWIVLKESLKKEKKKSW